MSEQNAENATNTTSETTDTNAGEDAVQGTVAEQEPTDIGDQKPMDDFGQSEQPEQQREQQQPADE